MPLAAKGQGSPRPTAAEGFAESDPDGTGYSPATSWRQTLTSHPPVRTRAGAGPVGAGYAPAPSGSLLIREKLASRWPKVRAEYGTSGEATVQALAAATERVAHKLHLPMSVRFDRASLSITVVGSASLNGGVAAMLIASCPQETWRPVPAARDDDGNLRFSMQAVVEPGPFVPQRRRELAVPELSAAELAAWDRVRARLFFE